MRSEFILSPSAYTRNILGTPVLAINHTAVQSSLASLNDLSSRIASLDALSTVHNAAYCRVCLFRNQNISKRIAISANNRFFFTCFRSVNFNRLLELIKRGSNRPGRMGFQPGIVLIVDISLNIQSLSLLPQSVLGIAASSWDFRMLWKEILSGVSSVTMYNRLSLKKTVEPWAAMPECTTIMVWKD